MEHKCEFCNSSLQSHQFIECENGDTMIDCPVCGTVMYSDSLNSIDSDIPHDKDKLAAFLYYHSWNNGINADDSSVPIYYLGTKNEFDNRYAERHNLLHITNKLVENWFPRTFNERMNLIILQLANQSSGYGIATVLSKEEQLSLFFIRRHDGFMHKLSSEQMLTQLQFVYSYLATNKLTRDHGFDQTGSFRFTLDAAGWQRVDELQRHQAESSKTAFVAMSFAKEMEPVRNAIKQAIFACGYVPRIMDEIEHNHQIVPEMLYEIREARFVIAELTGHNNGAYYEAGYALGLGKEIIHVCKSEQFGADGHFDVKQVNTVLWNDEKDLAEKLEKRIKATVES